MSITAQTFNQRWTSSFQTPPGVLNKWETSIFHQVQSWKMSNLRTRNKEQWLRDWSGGLRKMDELLCRYDISDACLQDPRLSNRKVKHWNGRRRASSDIFLRQRLIMSWQWRWKWPGMPFYWLLLNSLIFTFVLFNSQKNSSKWIGLIPDLHHWKCFGGRYRAFKASLAFTFVASPLKYSCSANAQGWLEYSARDSGKEMDNCGSFAADYQSGYVPLESFSSSAFMLFPSKKSRM